MKQVILFILCLVLCTGICGRVTAQAETDGQEQQNQKDELGLYAQSAVLMDAKTGRILYGKNEGVARPMASTTKIMTCIIALEYGNLSDTVTASQNAAAQPKVHLGVYKGQTFRLEDLLYSLMLESHNDAAVMIAEHVGGSVEGFAVLMNQKARDLGCGDTYFITPNGLDASKEENGQMKEHSTTAADLARIMNYCIGTSPKKDEFLKITGTQSYYFTDQDGKRSYSCQNHNALLTMMSGVFSGKTGFTGGAGYSYVGALEDGEREFTIALLGCGWPPHKTYKWSDARKLYTYGLEHFKMKDVFQEETFARVPVSGGLCWKEGEGAIDQVELSMMLNPDDMHLTLLMGEGEEARVVKKVPSILMAPVREGQQVGTVDYYLGEVLVKRFPVYAMQGVEKMNLRRAADRVLALFLVR